MVGIGALAHIGVTLGTRALGFVSEFAVHTQCTKVSPDGKWALADGSLPLSQSGAPLAPTTKASGLSPSATTAWRATAQTVTLTAGAGVVPEVPGVLRASGKVEQRGRCLVLPAG